MGSSSILPLIAQGVQPVQVPDVIGQAAKVQQIKTAQAEQEAIRARIGTEQAQQGAIAAQTQGQQIQNTIAQRQLDAQNSLKGLLQQNTTKLPDGSVATDMGKVIAQYGAQYPDYALALRGNMLKQEEQENTLKKSQFDLNASQVSHLGTMAATQGFDNPNIANDPQAAQKYANLYAAAQQQGVEHLLPANPNEFAKNPAAYAPRLSSFVQQSGGQAAALAQKGAQIDATQKQLTLARGEYAQLAQGAKTPQDLASAQSVISQKYPDVFPQLNLAPPGAIRSADGLQHAINDAQFQALSPDQRVTAAETAKKNTNEAIYQQGMVRAEQAKAGAEYAKVGIERQKAELDATQEYGVHLNGQPVAPGQPNGAGGAIPSGPGAPATVQAGSSGTVLNIPQADGSVKPTDLSKLGYWNAESPRVQADAMALLQGKQLSTRPGGKDAMVQDKALALASKVWPQFKSATATRDQYYADSSKAATNANTMIQHYPELMNLADQAGNGSLRPLNFVTLATKREKGDPAPTDLENQRDRFAAEADKYFSPMGSTAGEREEKLGPLSLSGSPQQLKSAATRTVQMVSQGIRERENTYNNQMGGAISGGGVSFLSPESKSVLQKAGVLGKLATSAHIADYAKQKRISIGQAQKEFESAGYKVQ